VVTAGESGDLVPSRARRFVVEPRGQALRTPSGQATNQAIREQLPLIATALLHVAFTARNSASAANHAKYADFNGFSSVAAEDATAASS
jgi:hypothetical protein